MTGRQGYRTMEMNGGSSVPTSLVPLAFPCFVLCSRGVETEGLLDYQGRAGIISIVQWNLRPVIFGVDFSHYTTFEALKCFKSSVLGASKIGLD